MSKFCIAWVAAALLVVTSSAQASIVFDNFNADEGHFGYAPNFSGTTVGEDSTSTADRVTTDAVEGGGSQQLVLVHDTSTTAFRLRHVSGGPPYNSTNAGSPVGNAGFSFTSSAATDGFIGFYLKTTATGWETQINLDGDGNTAGEMRGSPSTPIIADGEWHLYEWDLDAPIWGSVPGIATVTPGALPADTYTIDSIYFRDMDGSPGPTATILFDFVAKSDAGTIATLVPEPSAFALLALAVPAVLRRRRA